MDKKVFDAIKLDELIEDHLRRNLPAIQFKSNLDQLFDERMQYLESCSLRINALIQDYNNAVSEVKVDKKIEPKEKLKKLLTPLISLQKVYYPGYLTDNPKYRHRNHKFIDDSYVDLKNELDLEKLAVPLQKDPDEASIAVEDIRQYSVYFHREGCRSPVLRNLAFAFPGAFGDPRISVVKRDVTQRLGTDDANIYLSDEYIKKLFSQLVDKIGDDAKMSISRPTSIAEIYKYWLPTLSKDKITGNDLLDQMLVCYTIKRALNGDREALSGLVEALMPSNENIGGIKNYLEASLSRKRTSEIKRRLVNKFDNDTSRKTLQDHRGTVDFRDDEIREEVIALLPLIIRGFQATDICEIILDGKNEQDYLPFPKWLINFYITYLLEYFSFDDNNPFAPITDEPQWKSVSDKKYWKKFNSYSFVPGYGYKIGPRSNLYKWLYSKPYGKIAQIMRDRHWPAIRSQDNILAKHARKFKTAKADQDKLSPALEDVAETTTLLVNYGIPEVEAEIYCRCVIGKEKKARVARDYENMYREKIHRIISRVNSKLSKTPSFKQKWLAFKQECLDKLDRQKAKRNIAKSTKPMFSD